MPPVDHTTRQVSDGGQSSYDATSRHMSRREVLGAGVTLAVGGALAVGFRALHCHESGMRADVFIGKAADYNDSLARIIRDGLAAIGVATAELRGKRVLLKPNLVETAKGEPHINTNPAMMVAATEVFRDAGAAEVFVAEGQGHRRDSILVLEESGMDSALRDARLEFVDLNHDECVKVANAGRWSKLDSLYLPRSLLAADFIVSMPKMKTHHWAGVTCAMKNLFGVMPGVIYGWPKNVLHYAGITESILDINATVRPHLTIVDGIVGMEGDGPIMGTPKQLGAIVMGRNLPAVDATCVRLMRLDPLGVSYLSRASGKLGPIRENHITQRGERIASLQSRFKLLDVPHLRSLGAGSA